MPRKKKSFNSSNREPGGLPFPPGSHLATYLRDSGRDGQEMSIEQQERALRAWCSDNGYTLTRIFRDSRTGTSIDGRAGFEDLLRYFFSKSRPPEAGIVLWTFARFARDTDDATFYKAALRRQGFEVYALQEIIPEGSTGRLVEYIYDWSAADYSKKISTDIIRAQHDNIIQYGSLGGKPPKGFKQSDPIELKPHRDGTPHLVHRWVPDPELWETCRIAWQMRAVGTSYKEIHEKTRLFSAINSYSAFYRNRIYLGELHFAGHIIPDYVEPMIDLETWDTVHNLNQKNQRNTGPIAHNARRKGSSFLLSGILHCARCGALMNGELAKKRDETGDGRGYYTCSRRRTQWDCDAPRINSNKFEQAVIDRLITHIINPANLIQIQQERLNNLQTDIQSAINQRNELSQRLGNLRQRITNITDAIADTGYSKALNEKLRELESDQEQMSQQLRAFDIWIKTVPPNLTPDQLQRFSQNLTTIIRAADRDTQRHILHGFIQSVNASRDGQLVSVNIQYSPPPEDLISSLANIFPTDPTLTGPDPPIKYKLSTFTPPLGAPYVDNFSVELKRS